MYYKAALEDRILLFGLTICLFPKLSVYIEELNHVRGTAMKCRCSSSKQVPRGRRRGNNCKDKDEIDFLCWEVGRY
jgi:hypothetical protein